MMLYLILLSMLMILLCTLIVIRYLILNLSMTYETQWAGLRSGFLISMLEKLNLFCLTCAIGVNMDVASLSFFLEITLEDVYLN